VIVLCRLHHEEAPSSTLEPSSALRRSAVIDSYRGGVVAHDRELTFPSLAVHLAETARPRPRPFIAAWVIDQSTGPSMSSRPYRGPSHLRGGARWPPPPRPADVDAAVLGLVPHSFQTLGDLTSMNAPCPSSGSGANSRHKPLTVARVQTEQIARHHGVTRASSGRRWRDMSPT